jgi:hypothetical protein
MVVPKRSATIDHPDHSARNVFVRGVGHMSLPVDGRVVHEICTTLAHLDHEGQTVVVGVTPITSTTPERRGGDRRPARRATTRRRRGMPS